MGSFAFYNGVGYWASTPKYVYKTGTIRHPVSFLGGGWKGGLEDESLDILEE